eukprot:11449472-Prorocentrum_lima.AAC.1
MDEKTHLAAADAIGAAGGRMGRSVTLVEATGATEGQTVKGEVALTLPVDSSHSGLPGDYAYDPYVCFNQFLGRRLSGIRWGCC